MLEKAIQGEELPQSTPELEKPKAKPKTKPTAKKLTTKKSQVKESQVPVQPQAQQPKQSYAEIVKKGSGQSKKANLSQKAKASNSKASRSEAKVTQQSQPNQLILIADKAKLASQPKLDPKSLRDLINHKITARNNKLKGPIVARITKSLRENYVITTATPFTAQVLTSNMDVIKETFKDFHIIKFECPTTWIKLVAHNIPVSSFTDFSEEVKTYNNLQVVGNPRWLVKPENKEAGSVVFAVKSTTEEKTCVQQGLIFAGTKVKVVKYRPFSLKTQCFKCQGFGHNPTTCQQRLACRLCSKSHHTKNHICPTCKKEGKYEHLVSKCINCTRNHEADSLDCEVVQAIRA